jgi:hypothetical protein
VGSDAARFGGFELGRVDVGLGDADEEEALEMAFHPALPAEEVVTSPHGAREGGHVDREPGFFAELTDKSGLMAFVRLQCSSRANHHDATPGSSPRKRRSRFESSMTSPRAARRVVGDRLSG